jgi:hypothetical protein
MSPAFAPLKCAQGSSQQNRIQQTKETAIMEAGSTRQDFPSDPEKRAQEAQQPRLPEPTPTAALTQEQLAQQQEEQKLIRRLQMMMNMVMSVIGQDESLTVDEAAEMVADSRKAALAMFPDKELAYNLIYKPRLQRLMRERYRIQ